jgi:hypothetical protein
VNYDAIKIWVDIAQFLITGGIGIYIYLLNKGDAINTRLSSIEDAHDKRLDNHQERLSAVEATIEHLPTHNELAELREDVAGLKADMGGQTALLIRLEKTVSRISDWLIDRAK